MASTMVPVGGLPVAAGLTRNRRDRDYRDEVFGIYSRRYSLRGQIKFDSRTGIIISFSREPAAKDDHGRDKAPDGPGRPHQESANRLIVEDGHAERGAKAGKYGRVDVGRVKHRGAKGDQRSHHAGGERSTEKVEDLN